MSFRRPPVSPRPSTSRRRWPLAAAGLLAGIMLNAPAAMAVGEAFGVNLRSVPPQLRQFPTDAPGAIATTVGTTSNTYAIDFNTAGTILFAIQNTTAGVAWDFGSIDLFTGAFVPTVAVTGLTGDPSGMSVDPLTETFYVSSPTTLYTLDTSTGVVTPVGDFGTGGLMIDIAVDNNGNMFGHDIGTDALYSIDKATGVATLIGFHGLAANFAQGMDFDPTTNTLYATIYTGGGTGKYVSWDTATGAITELADTTSLNVEMELAIRAGMIGTGACCLPDGSCIIASNLGCTGQGGVYNGDNVDCSMVVCPQPGACCLPNFACSVISPSQCATAGGAFQGEGTLCGACPPPPLGVNPEVEPNDNKAAANGPFVLEPGHSILGTTTGTSTTVAGPASSDNFIVQTTAAPLGIYQHRLVLTTGGTAGHVGTIRGLTQTTGVINPGSDAVLQTSSTVTTPPRYNQWYGFGKQEQLYYRVTGTTSTTEPYSATLETTPIVPTDIGTYYNGNITIDRPVGVTTDIDFWVYDSNLNAIPDYGNDTPNAMTRSFAPGTYYIAYTNFNFANDQPAASDEGFLSGSVTDFPNVATNSSTTLAPTLGIRMTDAFSQVSFNTPKNSQFDVVWLQFTVNDTPPTTGACCLEDGSCIQATPLGCAAAGGAYNGDNVDCSMVVCPQPGACCFANFGCSVVSANQCAVAGGTYQGNGTACGSCPPPPPGTFPEAEPNDSKAQATPVQGMESGNLIIGNTTGASTTVPGPASADYFDITTAQAPLGFYRHRLILEGGGSTARTATIRGLNQIAAVAGAWPCSSLGSAGPTDTSLQTSFVLTGTTTEASQWFGFGKGERVYYRVDGTTATTTDYTATLETTPVPITEIGDFAPGQITITTMDQGHTTDTDFWVYDSDFNAIPGYGNDDNSIDGGGTGAGLQGILTRPYEPGTYYLAMSTFQMALSEPSPCDDDFRTGTLMDFPGAVLNSTTTLNSNVSFAITDALGTVAVPATRPGQFDVLMFSFTVGGGDDCPPDWNDDGVVNSGDISSFLTAWLDSIQNGNLIADFNNDMVVNSGDISAFLTAWLAAVGGNC